MEARGVPLPPLNEQQRIVAVLDEAFEALARARANIEANLADAEEVFERTLDLLFEAGGDEWLDYPFSASVETVTPPQKVQRSDYLVDGAYPIVSQGREFIEGYWDDPTAIIRPEDALIVFGDHTREVKYVNFDFVAGADGTKILKAAKGIQPRTLYWAIKRIDLRGLGYARHFKELKKQIISLPKKPEVQDDLAGRIDAIFEQSQALAAAYTAQLTDLAILRQTLLARAFRGELT